MFGIFSQIQGWIKIKGATTGAMIGNVSDQLKVIDQDAIAILNQIAISQGVSVDTFFKQGRKQPASRNQEDIPGTDYTVPANKNFKILNMIASFDAQATVIVRLMKQPLGTGAFVERLAITLEVGGQGQSTIPLSFQNGLQMGVATDKFKLTIESSIAGKGSVWGFYSGSEV